MVVGTHVDFYSWLNNDYTINNNDRGHQELPDDLKYMYTRVQAVPDPNSHCELDSLRSTIETRIRQSFFSHQTFYPSSSAAYIYETMRDRMKMHWTFSVEQKIPYKKARDDFFRPPVV